MSKSASVARWVGMVYCMLSLIIAVGIKEIKAQPGFEPMIPNNLVNKSLRFKDGKAFGINYGVASEPVTTLAVGNNNATNAAPFILVSGAFTASGVITWLNPNVPYFLNIQESTFPAVFGPQGPGNIEVRLLSDPSVTMFFAESTNGAGIRSDNVEGNFKTCTNTDSEAVESITLESEGCLFIRSSVGIDVDDDGATFLRDRFQIPLVQNDSVLQFVLTKTSDVDILNPESGTNIDPNSSTLADLFPIFRGAAFVSADIDTFRIKLPGPGELTVRTVGFADTFMRLLDPSGQVIASNDDGPIDANSEITRTLTAGTYLVQVEGLSFNALALYILQSIFVPQGTPSNLAASLRSVESDTVRQLRYHVTSDRYDIDISKHPRSILTSNRYTIVDSVIPQQTFDNPRVIDPNSETPMVLDIPDQMDIFRIDLPSDGILEVVIGGDIFASAMPMFFNSDRVVQERKGVEFPNSIHRFLPQGTYFFSVSTDPPTSGNYTLLSSFVQSTIDTDAQELGNVGAPVRFKEDPPSQEFNISVSLPTLMDEQFVGGGFAGAQASGGPRCETYTGLSPEICTRGLVSLDQNDPLPDQIEVFTFPLDGSGGGDYIFEVFSSPISMVNTAACNDNSNIVPEATLDAGGQRDGSDAQLIEREAEVRSCLRITGSNDDTVPPETDDDGYILNLAANVDVVTFSAVHNQPGGALRLFIKNSADNTILDTCLSSPQTDRIDCTIALPQNIRQLFAFIETVIDSGMPIGIGNYTLDVLPSNLLNQEPLPIPPPL